MKPLKYLFISSMLFVATSCGNSWLDLEPSTSVDTETSIKILSDVEFTLNGIYSTMQSSDAYSGRLVYYGDVTGDDMQAVSSTKRVANYYRFNFTKDDNPSSHWSYLYSIIQNCNLILMNIDKLVIDEDDKAYRDDLKGEALAIRGLALFDLTRIFGYPYLQRLSGSFSCRICTSESGIFYSSVKRSGKTISGSIKGYPCSIFCCDVVNLDRFRESGRVDLFSGGISGYLRKYPVRI